MSDTVLKKCYYSLIKTTGNLFYKIVGTSSYKVKWFAVYSKVKSLAVFYKVIIFKVYILK